MSQPNATPSPEPGAVGTFCTCHDERLPDGRASNTPCQHVIDGDRLIPCPRCGLPDDCTFSYLSDDPNDPDAEGTPHAATRYHMGYRVCERHRGIAVDNVASSWT